MQYLSAHLLNNNNSVILGVGLEERTTSLYFSAMSEFSTISIYYFCNKIRKKILPLRKTSRYSGQGRKSQKTFQSQIETALILSHLCSSPQRAVVHILYLAKTSDQCFANILTKFLSKKIYLHHDLAYICVHATEIKQISSF